MSDLAGERYVSLATFRRSGAEVRTPVWIAPDGGRWVVYTNRHSGKVKRIRGGGRAAPGSARAAPEAGWARVRVAACNARGAVRGAFVEARARVVDDPADVERGLAAVRRKYGWQMALAEVAGRLSGRWRDRTVLEVHPEATS